MALVVFVALVVLSVCALGWYLIAGHSWNVAASNIDDTFGSMDGYTAIVYPGTNDGNLETDSENGRGKPSDGSPLGGDGSPDSTGARDNATDPGEGDEPAPSEGDAASDPDAPLGLGASDARDVAEAGDAAVVPPSTSERPLRIDDVEESYEEKNATVFSLDTTDIGQYREGTILRKGDHRFGVFGVDRPLSTILLEKQIAYFKRYKVDFIVAIAPDRTYVEGVDGIDIVLCTHDDELSVMGETVDNTFYVDTPEIGKVGAVLISPNNVVSAKVIQEL